MHLGTAKIIPSFCTFWIGYYSFQEELDALLLVSPVVEDAPEVVVREGVFRISFDDLFVRLDRFVDAPPAS